MAGGALENGLTPHRTMTTGARQNAARLLDGSSTVI
jgi:hypothetical protein